jgi:hypothetical protein
MFAAPPKIHTFVAANSGDVAQLVEQRTENPCVGGSIPSVTTRTANLHIILHKPF